MIAAWLLITAGPAFAQECADDQACVEVGWIKHRSGLHWQYFRDGASDQAWVGRLPMEEGSAWPIDAEIRTHEAQVYLRVSEPGQAPDEFVVYENTVLEMDDELGVWLHKQGAVYYRARGNFVIYVDRIWLMLGGTEFLVVADDSGATLVAGEEGEVIAIEGPLEPCPDGPVITETGQLEVCPEGLGHSTYAGDVLRFEAGQPVRVARQPLDGTPDERAEALQELAALDAPSWVGATGWRLPLTVGARVAGGVGAQGGQVDPGPQLRAEAIYRVRLLGLVGLAGAAGYSAGTDASYFPVSLGPELLYGPFAAGGQARVAVGWQETCDGEVAPALRPGFELTGGYRHRLSRHHELEAQILAGWADGFALNGALGWSYVF